MHALLYFLETLRSCGLNQIRTVQLAQQQTCCLSSLHILMVEQVRYTFRLELKEHSGGFMLLSQVHLSKQHILITC